MKLHLKPRPRRSSYEINMTEGPLMGKLVRFSIPLALSGVLQLLFNAADIVVVGRFAGSHALAAVGSTSALNMLIVNLFIGLSIGRAGTCGRRYIQPFSRQRPAGSSSFSRECFSPAPCCS